MCLCCVASSLGETLAAPSWTQRCCLFPSWWSRHKRQWSLFSSNPSRLWTTQGLSSGASCWFGPWGSCPLIWCHRDRRSRELCQSFSQMRVCSYRRGRVPHLCVCSLAASDVVPPHPGWRSARYTGLSSCIQMLVLARPSLCHERWSRLLAGLLTLCCCVSCLPVLPQLLVAPQESPLTHQGGGSRHTHTRGWTSSRLCVCIQSLLQR